MTNWFDEKYYSKKILEQEKPKPFVVHKSAIDQCDFCKKGPKEYSVKFKYCNIDAWIRVCYACKINKF